VLPRRAPAGPGLKPTLTPRPFLKSPRLLVAVPASWQRWRSRIAGTWLGQPLYPDRPQRSRAGTHDNETAVGWWADSAGARDRAYVAAYLGSDGSDIAWDLIRAAFASVSRTSIVMMQARGAASTPRCGQAPVQHRRCEQAPRAQRLGAGGACVRIAELMPPVHHAHPAAECSRRCRNARVSRSAPAPLHARRQDIMRLDNSARMNLPGTAGGNWAWRIGGADVWQRLAPEAEALRALAETYGRLAPQPVCHTIWGHGPVQHGLCHSPYCPRTARLPAVECKDTQQFRDGGSPCCR